MQFTEAALLQLIYSLRWESKGKVNPLASIMAPLQTHLREWKPCEVEPFMPWFDMIIVTWNTIFWLHRITELAEWVQVHCCMCILDWIKLPAACEIKLTPYFNGDHQGSTQLLFKNVRIEASQIWSQNMPNRTSLLAENRLFFLSFFFFTRSIAVNRA